MPFLGFSITGKANRLEPSTVFVYIQIKTNKCVHGKRMLRSSDGRTNGLFMFHIDRTLMCVTKNFNLSKMDGHTNTNITTWI